MGNKWMINLFLYTAVVMIWGSSWIMVSFQVGTVPPEVSVAYRIAIASALMFLWAFAVRQPLRRSIRDHGFMALQGALIFSTNFFLLYTAASYLTTGIISVVFSTASAMTLAFKTTFMGHRPDPRAICGALLGIMGVGILFWPQVTGLALQTGAGMGLLLSLGGTLSFSLGGIVSARNQSAGVSGPVCVAWAMGYGALLLCVLALCKGHWFAFDSKVPYILSLLYLALISSVLGFAAYFALLKRIDAERAAYATVLFPVVALLLSTLFEAYQWTATAIAGVAVTLAGNVLVLRSAPKKLNSVHK
jgi:drug/metabolite transporter (DMT)-like permease